MTQPAQEIRGKHVVALEEGRDMGRISKVYFNPKKKRISGLAVKESRLRGEEKWVKVEDIERVGDDFVFIPESKNCRSAKPKGRSLKDMTGLEVTTLDGKLLGALEDVEVDEEWGITELNLSGRKSLDLDPDSDVFGEDAILVRSGADTRVREKRSGNNKGFLARMFVGDSILESVDRMTRKDKQTKRSASGTRKSKKAKGGKKRRSGKRKSRK
jgi:sporulation protein YlmC with PRC-barrel domain